MHSNRRKFFRYSILSALSVGIAPYLAFGNRKREPSATLTIHHETDICVIGGSCTGVFAAIRAARLGAKVTLIEKQNAFGGVATNSLVFVWHSLKDTEFKKDIIAGLTRETMDRLKRRSAVIETDGNPSDNITRSLIFRGASSGETSCLMPRHSCLPAHGYMAWIAPGLMT